MPYVVQNAVVCFFGKTRHISVIIERILEVVVNMLIERWNEDKGETICSSECSSLFGEKPKQRLDTHQATYAW